MLRASALYLVIVIALVIGVICSSLVVVAYFYRAEYQKKFRYDKLSHNLLSGVNLLLTTPDSAYLQQTKISLFGAEADSVALQIIAWGIYDIGVVKAFTQQDTIYKAFSIASPSICVLPLTDNGLSSSAIYNAAHLSESTGLAIEKAL